MMELFLPILGVILSTTTEKQKYKVFISLPEKTKLFQRFKSFLRRQNVTISFKQTNIWLNILIFVCSEQITFKTKHFNDL